MAPSLTLCTLPLSAVNLSANSAQTDLQIPPHVTTSPPLHHRLPPGSVTSTLDYSHSPRQALLLLLALCSPEHTVPLYNSPPSPSRQPRSSQWPVHHHAISHHLSILTTTPLLPSPCDPDSLACLPGRYRVLPGEHSSQTTQGLPQPLGKLLHLGSLSCVTNRAH